MADVHAAVRGLRSALLTIRRPPFARPGHFYSPLTAPADTERAVEWTGLDPVGVDLRANQQLGLVAGLVPMMAGYRPDRWHAGNGQYDTADAAVLHAMLRKLRPGRIIEVGSGYSTAVMLDTIEQFDVPTSVTCIEPYPQRLLSRLRGGERVELRQVAAQEIPLADFDQLAPGDVLFIDSTHVLKPGSDVAWLYLHVLPRLQPGVIVHIHDTFWPFEYPEYWLRQRRDWTELYLLRAMLTGTTMWQIELFSSWVWREHPELIPEQLRRPAPGSIWLRKTASHDQQPVR
jgi:predicted O-methyltransferase YrrM